MSTHGWGRPIDQELYAALDEAFGFGPGPTVGPSSDRCSCGPMDDELAELLVERFIDRWIEEDC